MSRRLEALGRYLARRPGDIDARLPTKRSLDCLDQNHEACEGCGCHCHQQGRVEL